MKRVSLLLTNVIEQYEAKFGAIELDADVEAAVKSKPARGDKS